MPFTVKSLGSESQEPSLIGSKGFTYKGVQGEEDLLKSTRRASYQPIIGALESTLPGMVTGGAHGLISMQTPKGPLLEEQAQERELADQLGENPRILPQAFEQGFEQSKEEILPYVPSISNIAEGTESLTGVPLGARSDLDQYLRLGGLAAGFQPGNLKQKSVSGALAPLIGASAEEAGVPKPVAELLGLGLAPYRPGKIPTATRSKYPSGIEKPLADTSKLTKYGKISPERQDIAISHLNEQAKKFAQESVEKHLPIIKKIEQGLDFEGNFQKGFSDLQTAAQKANPIIDLEPVEELLEKTFEKYHGIPNPHPDAKKVLKEAQSFARNPQSSLHNLLKIYRSNNKKMSSIFETAHTKGKQKEYVDFLVDLNKSISSAMKKTLPEDSAFIKRFEQLNSDFSNFKKATEATRTLEPLLGGKLSFVRLEKLATDSKIAKKLSLAMGEQGSKEIIQIAKDLKAAHESIKNIPVKARSQFESIFPIGAILGGTLGKAISAVKLKDYSQRLLGYVLTKPTTRRYFKEALEAVVKGDPKSYERAMKNVLRALGSGKDLT